MKIVGIQKNSMVDYPGKIAAAAFTPGCNMNCFYCHNRSIICEGGQDKTINPKEFLMLLQERKHFLDGAVISGGEPTLQADLIEYIFAIKSIGYPVKLDTNGTNPKMLERLVGQNLIDYIAMDIKAPFDKYSEICGVDVSLQNIEESVSIIMGGEVDYEFRTTFVPELSKEDGIDIAKRIKGAKKFVLQQYKKPEYVGDFYDSRLHKAPHTSHTIQGLGKQIECYVQSFEYRGGENNVFEKQGLC